VAHLGFFDYLDTIAFLGAMEHIAKDVLGLPSHSAKQSRRRKCTQKQLLAPSFSY
jgi:hypothetical protein